jgi:Flp pilus assembly protein TadD
LVWTAVGDPAKIPDALRRIDQAIDDHGPLDDLLDTRGRLLVAAGRFDDGIRDLREAADAAPTAARFIQLAVVYRQAGRLNEAAEAVQIARRFGLRPADIAPHDTDAVRDLTKN